MKFLALPLILATASATNHKGYSFCSTVSSLCSPTASLQQVSAYCSSIETLSTVTAIAGSTTVTVKPSCAGPRQLSSANAAQITSAPHADNIAAAAIEHAPLPACVGPQNHQNSCGCISLLTHSTTVTLPTATVTGPFQIEASGSTWQGQYACTYPNTSPTYLGYLSEDTINSRNITIHSFFLDLAKRLRSVDYPDYAALIPQGASYGELQFYNNYTNAAMVHCSIEESNCYLDCQVNGNKPGTNWVCGSGGFKLWTIAVQQYELCQNFTPIVNAMAP